MDKQENRWSLSVFAIVKHRIKRYNKIKEYSYMLIKIFWISSETKEEHV